MKLTTKQKQEIEFFSQHYVEDFKNKKLIRDLLEIIYYEVKQNERNTKEEPRASNGGL